MLISYRRHGAVCFAQFLAISFDASGATTGALAVPFILALSVGTKLKDSRASENSFGLLALASERDYRGYGSGHYSQTGFTAAIDANYRLAYWPRKITPGI